MPATSITSSPTKHDARRRRYRRSVHGARRGGAHIHAQPGVKVDEVLRWESVPPMYVFDDPDGNQFAIVEVSE